MGSLSRVVCWECAGSCSQLQQPKSNYALTSTSAPAAAAVVASKLTVEEVGDCNGLLLCLRRRRRRSGEGNRKGILLRYGSSNNSIVICKGVGDGGNGSPPRPEYSSDAKIRSEVIAPFRSFRMFFYGAFIASGSIGGLIAVIRLIGALNHAPGAEAPIEIAKGLGIDLAAVIIFALLYRSDAKAREIALAKLSREEDLANLRLQLDNKKVVTLAQLRGISRIVILAGPGSYIEEALKQSEPFKAALLERGVLLAPYATDGATLTVDSPAVAPIADVKPGADAERKWIAKPIYTSEWGRWINEQKRLANVSMEKPVYISLRLDGRVRGSGVGIPSWRAMSLQLPPLKGMWGGALDGMDGRV
ncbi:unnamed protein product [Sphagnum troendelagicum]|uniref:Protein LOW PSII ACCUMULATION 1, chloroplastic n=1 Tax=Sphagnum troendelagicum TaxID=128251 RepID=A0ABP0TPP1_9BRYO